MNTTISISTDIRDKIKTFGNKGDTYSDIIEKLYKSAVQRQLQELLMDNTNTISAKKALKKAEQRWQ